MRNTVPPPFETEDTPQLYEPQIFEKPANLPIMLCGSHLTDRRFFVFIFIAFTRNSCGYIESSTILSHIYCNDQAIRNNFGKYVLLFCVFCSMKQLLKFLSTVDTPKKRMKLDAINDIFIFAQLFLYEDQV